MKLFLIGILGIFCATYFIISAANASTLTLNCEGDLDGSPRYFAFSISNDELASDLALLREKAPNTNFDHVKTTSVLYATVNGSKNLKDVAVSVSLTEMDDLLNGVAPMKLLTILTIKEANGFENIMFEVSNQNGVYGVIAKYIDRDSDGKILGFAKMGSLTCDVIQ